VRSWTARILGSRNRTPYVTMGSYPVQEAPSNVWELILAMYLMIYEEVPQYVNALAPIFACLGCF